MEKYHEDSAFEADGFLNQLEVFIDKFYRENRKNFVGGMSKASFMDQVFKSVEKDIDDMDLGVDAGALMKRALIFATSLLL